MPRLAPAQLLERQIRPKQETLQDGVVTFSPGVRHEGDVQQLVDLTKLSCLL